MHLIEATQDSRDVVIEMKKEQLEWPLIQSFFLSWTLRYMENELSKLGCSIKQVLEMRAMRTRW